MPAGLPLTTHKTLLALPSGRRPWATSWPANRYARASAGLPNAQGELPAARRLQEQALEAYRRLLGEEHPQTLSAIRNLAATRQALEEQ